MKTQQTEVLIVGAGIAGLAAARELSRQGLSVVVLEARDRPGGRILTVHPPSPGVPVELGAEFVHGRPPQLWRLANEAGVSIEELNGEPWCQNDRTPRLERCDNLFDEVEWIFEAMKGVAGDCSFAEFLREHGKEFSEAAKARATSYVEGFHAADRNRISVHSLVKSNEADEAIDGNSQFRIVEGYESLVDHLLRQNDSGRGFSLRLSTVAQEVEWAPGTVRIAAESEREGLVEFVAPSAVITLPLGVLQAAAAGEGEIRFKPQLKGKAGALARLEAGSAVRVTMRFSKRFWADSDFSPALTSSDASGMGFLFAPAAEFPTWWTAMPRPAPILTGWAAGPRADALHGCGHDEITQRALGALAQIFSVKKATLASQVEAAYTHDWQADPFSRGAYSYALVGGAEAARELAAPLEGTLFFAGEATHFGGHHGTVHGALETGLRAADELVSAQSHRLAS